MSENLKRCVLLAVLVVLLTTVGLCEGHATLYVDNQEEDIAEPERLNLRAQPSTNAAVIGMFYTGTEVINLGPENDTFTHVQIDDMTGYMATQFLITKEEAVQRYGENSMFGTCRAAQVDLTGLWKTEQPLLEATDQTATSLSALRTGDDVRLIGIIDDWAYIATAAGQKGYVPLDVLTEVGSAKVSIVAGTKVDGSVSLYEKANDRSPVIMKIKNGTACFALFGKTEGNWKRVRVGGVSGWIKYTQASKLMPIGDVARSAVPYYPLLMQTKRDAMLTSDIADGGQRYMTLGEGMKVEVLAEAEDYVYVRTYEGGAGAYDCGDFGYIALNDLSLTPAGTCVGIAQMDDGDLPVIVLDAPDKEGNRLGALCAGAQVRVSDYTQTDYVQIMLGDVKGYVLKTQLRMLGDSGVTSSGRIPQRARVMEQATLRVNTSESAGSGVEITQGSRVYMLGMLGGYAYVLAADGPDLSIDDVQDKTGFVQLDKLDAPASTTHLTASVNTDKVNLRDKGNTNGEIIARVRLDALLRVADYGLDWCCVVTPDGKRGYIMTKYLEFD